MVSGMKNYAGESTPGSKFDSLFLSGPRAYREISRDKTSFRGCLRPVNDGSVGHPTEYLSFTATNTLRMDSDGTLDERALERLRVVLREHPIRLGVLFGSQATGTAGHHSDVDVAVEFEPTVEDRFRAHLDLGTALALELGTDDVDVVDLETVRPAIGYAALAEGRLLVGDADRLEELASQFDQERERPTRRDRRERFDGALERLEELV